MDSYTHMYDVLRILLQHSEPSTALLCSFAQVCQGWKTATQVLHRQWRGRLDVELEASEHPRPEAWEDTIRSFSTWLGKHADLVRSITVNKGTGEDAQTVGRFLPAQQALAAALLRCQRNSNGSGTASSSDNNSAAASEGLLQLQAYSSDCMGSSSILQALWSSHITALHLSLPQHSRADASLPSSQHLMSAFKNLPKLQSLSLSFELQQALSEACCKAMGGLSCLTKLDLGVGLNAGTMKVLQLPEVLPSLQLQQLRLHCNYEGTNPVWDLSSFTQLTELEFTFASPSAFVHDPRPTLKLPAQVWVLDISGVGLNAFTKQLGVADNDYYNYVNGQVKPRSPPILVNHLTALQQLQAFSTTTAFALPDYVLRHLAELPTLQDISISYECADAARLNQQDWVHLQHLKHLSINLYSKRIMYRPVSWAELHDLLGAVGSVTTLTSLQVNLNSHPEPHELTYYGYYMTRYFGCPFANDEREGGGNSSGSQPRLLHPSLQLPQAPSSAAALGPLNIFSHLTGLEHLRELQVSRATRKPDAHNRGLLSGLSGEQEPALLEGSAQQLTALTALTSLQLYNLGAAVGDTAGLAVAASLRRLRHLALCDCDISSAATKAALRRLPMLTELVMKDAEGGEEGDSEDQEG